MVEEDGELSFSRAKELREQRFAEEERKRIKREMRKRLEQEVDRKRLSRSVEEDEQPDTATPPKKRKVSTNLEEEKGAEEDDTLGYESKGSPNGYDKAMNMLVTVSKEKHNNEDSLSARYSKSLLQKTKTQIPSTNVIPLSDSDDSDGGARQKSTANKSIPIDSDDDVIQITKKPVNGQTDDSQLDDDEEFPELVAQARERERLRAETAKKSFSEKNHTENNHDSFGFDSAADTDPSVMILITSEIEGAIPLRVKRKMSQKLREARWAWCDRQTMPQYPTITQLRSAIFLTWKREKVYDYTTCEALGLKLDDLDEVSNMDGILEGKVHLEAWTEEAFAKAQKAENEEEDGEEETPQEEEVKIRLVMKAKDMEPVKLFVRKSTLLSKLISAFVTAREVPEDKEVSLFFDGDELNPDDTVQDTELESMDNVEVHIT